MRDQAQGEAQVEQGCIAREDAGARASGRVQREKRSEVPHPSHLPSELSQQRRGQGGAGQGSSQGSSQGKGQWGARREYCHPGRGRRGEQRQPCIPKHSGCRGCGVHCRPTGLGFQVHNHLQVKEGGHWKALLLRSRAAAQKSSQELPGACGWQVTAVDAAAAQQGEGALGRHQGHSWLLLSSSGYAVDGQLGEGCSTAAAVKARKRWSSVSHNAIAEEAGMVLRYRA
jgi:hypothetical protein